MQINKRNICITFFLKEKKINKKINGSKEMLNEETSALTI